MFNKDQVYFGKEMVSVDESPTGDFAVVRVDRKITAPGAKPLKVRDDGSPSAGSNLGAIGYPSGLPVKIAFGKDTRLMRDEDPWPIANLDTYGGNSGSAVFNAKGEVEGILVRGAVDYRFTAVCFRSNKIEDSEGSEAVTKANKFVLNCLPSKDTGDDWTTDDAMSAEFLCCDGDPPPEIDLRRDWWPVGDQKKSGACVGFAAADGLLRWHYVQEGMISEDEKVSPRFIWMATKEIDEFTHYPTSFLDSAGTSTKTALKVAQKYGCVLETMLGMDGKLSGMGTRAFFSIASQYRINAFYNLCKTPGSAVERIKHWLSEQDPVLTRLDVDEAFKYAQRTEGHLVDYNPEEAADNGGHAVSIVGFKDDYLIIRNSWGDNWGDKGFAYAHREYFDAAFTEAYGAVLNRKKIILPDRYVHDH
ncbi:C1 family peptidase [Sedimentitalea sp.]|uniref:C1 family peptidase n=1 Tax=Sedimentitalea sp. TaxID=2048915 RepID=UPI0032983512